MNHSRNGLICFILATFSSFQMECNLVNTITYNRQFQNTYHTLQSTAIVNKVGFPTQVPVDTQNITVNNLIKIVDFCI